MPYISCDDAFCEEKALTGHDCYSDHWIPPVVKTSRMAAITNPQRFGFEPVDIFFGVVRPRPERVVTCKGDLLRDLATGQVVTFEFRQNDEVHTAPL